MKYWFYNENCAYDDWQLEMIIDKTRLEHKTAISEEAWNEIWEQSQSTGRPIVNNPETNMPMLGDPYQPAEAELLAQERDGLTHWIEAQGYIVTLIGAGAATAEEFSAEIAEMKQKKIRIHEIDSRLADLEA